jgi:glutamate synthase (NADPH) small chain
MDDIYKQLRLEDWRAELRKTTPGKERMAIGRVKMPEVPAAERVKSNIEVNSGLTAEMAATESKRCLDCVTPTCISGCPVGINIPAFIKNIERGQFLQAAKVIKESSSLPAVCGRVCPQEKQCEAQCFYQLKTDKQPVAIGYLERFAADYDLENGKQEKLQVKPNANKIAVVGSGPAGLAFAAEMAKLGYDITVFEALHQIGGVLKYGIPEFRLPNTIVEKEISNLKEIGVKFETNCIIGRTVTLEELEANGFRGLFVGSGAGLPRFMNIPGENLVGVFSANEYLTRINLMQANESFADTPVLRGKNVAVIGGGNTAMDAVRTAKRQGAERAMLVYRRSLEEMPARQEEIHHAMEEGVEFLCLANPVQYMSDERGRVKEAIIQKMELGQPDASGRRSPQPLKGSEYPIPADTVIVSVGVSPNPLIPQSIPALEVSKWGTINVAEGMQTSIPYIFAGGDIVRGGATVILAMGDGKNAARSMHRHIQEKMGKNSAAGFVV